MFLAPALSLVTMLLNKNLFEREWKKNWKSAFSKLFLDTFPFLSLPSLSRESFFCVGVFLWKCDSWKLMKDGFTNNDWQVARVWIISTNFFSFALFWHNSKNVFLPLFALICWLGSAFKLLQIMLAFCLSSCWMRYFLLQFSFSFLERNDDDDICGCFFSPWF